MSEFVAHGRRVYRCGRLHQDSTRWVADRVGAGVGARDIILHIGARGLRVLSLDLLDDDGLLGGDLHEGPVWVLAAGARRDRVRVLRLHRWGLILIV